MGCSIVGRGNAIRPHCVQSQGYARFRNTPKFSLDKGDFSPNSSLPVFWTTVTQNSVHWRPDMVIIPISLSLLTVYTESSSWARGTPLWCEVTGGEFLWVCFFYVLFFRRAVARCDTFSDAEIVPVILTLFQRFATFAIWKLCYSTNLCAPPCSLHFASVSLTLEVMCLLP